MESIKFYDLDHSPINFELSEEDLTSIQGGITSLDFKFDFNIGDVKFEYPKIEDLKFKYLNTEDDKENTGFKININIKIQAFPGDDLPEHPIDVNHFLSLNENKNKI